jgi:hypothetical protein
MGSAAASTPALPNMPGIFSGDLHLWRSVRVRPLSYFFVAVVRAGLLNLTPTPPPPFSSMNWTPAAPNTFTMVARVPGSPAYRPTSMLVIVFR